MTSGSDGAVVVDTMAISALLSATRNPVLAAAYRTVIGSDRVVVSFATVTELRYGALRAGWGELRRRALERDLAKFVVVQPDDQLMYRCAELRSSCARIGHGLGQKIHEADRWIAATALRMRIDVVSDDAVFHGVPGLTVRGLPRS